MLQNRDKLRRLTPDNEVTRRVQNLVEERRKLVEEKTAQLNRLTGYLKVYFPQMLEWFAKLDTKLACELLERWPSLEELQAAAPAEVRKFFRQHRGRHPELTEWRLQGIGQAMSAIRDGAVIEAKGMVVQVIARVLRTLLEGIAALDGRLRRRRKPIPIFSFSNRFREPERRWRHVCWRHWAHNAIVMPVQKRCRSTAALPR